MSYVPLCARLCDSYLQVYILFQNTVTGSPQSSVNGTLYDLTWTLPKSDAVCDSTCDFSLTVQTRSTNTVPLQCTGKFLLKSLLSLSYLNKYLKPLSHQTAITQRLYSVLKPCQHAVGSPRNMIYDKNIKFISKSVYTTSSQRPHHVPTASLQRPWRFHSSQAVAAACSQRAHGALTVCTKRSHSAHTAFSQQL